MKKIFFLLVMLFVSMPFKMFAQWTSLNSPATLELQSVYFINSNTGYVGGAQGTFKTTNSGTTWGKMQYVSGPDSLWLEGLNEQHIFAFGTDTIYIAGWNVWNDNEAIVKTTDGGINWAIQYKGSMGTGFKSIYFTSATTGYVVGLGGRILGTTDGGTNWIAQTSGTKNNLYSVFFATKDTGYVGGQNIILKTTNGGATWKSLTLPSSPTVMSLCFINSNVGFVGSSTGDILKTLDGGITWTVQISNTTLPLRSIIFSNDSTGYIGGGAGAQGFILKTTTGGAYWEKHPSATGNAVNSLFFTNANTGFAVGYNGLIKKTINGGGGTSPFVDFTLTSSTFCSDSVVYFYNQGRMGYTYKWFDNDTLFTTAFNASKSFKNSGTHTVKLVVSNGTYTDSMSKSFSVIAAPIIKNFTLSAYPQDTVICGYSLPSIVVDSSEYGVEYQLYRGTTPVGQSFTGGWLGQSIFFPTDTISNTTIFNVVATKKNGCATVQRVAYKTIVVSKPKSNLKLTLLSNPVLCVVDNNNTYNFSINIDSSEAGITYMFDKNYTGNGGTLNMSGTTSIGGTTTFFVTAKNKFGCKVQLNDSVIVKVEQIQADFTPSTNIAFKGDTINITNNSVGNSYLWNFGKDANYSTDTAFTPKRIVYSTTGEKIIRLEVTSKLGCKDTFSTPVEIINATPSGKGDFCWAVKDTNINNKYKVLAYHRDFKGNNYITGYYYEGRSWRGNPLYNAFFAKINKNGKMVWLKEQSQWNYSIGDKYVSSFGTGITSDTLGNVYLSGTFSSETFMFDSIMINTQNNASHVFVYKFDSLGIAQWAIHGENFSYDESSYSTDITIDKKNNLYVAICQPKPNVSIDYTFVNGTIPHLSGEIIILKIDQNGHYINHIAEGGTYYCSGSLYNPDADADADKWEVGISPQIKIDDKLGQVYLLGDFYCNRIEFGSFSLISQEDDNGYIAVCDTALNNWINAFKIVSASANEDLSWGTALNYMTSFDIDYYGNFYVLGGWDTEERGGGRAKVIIGTDTLVNQASKNFISKYDNNGNLLWYNLSRGGIVSKDILDGEIITSNSNGVYVYGTWGDSISFHSKNVASTGLYSKGGNNKKDLLLAEYSADGNLLWANSYGDTTYDDAYGLQKDDCGNLFILAKSKSIKLGSTLLNDTIDRFIIGEFAADNNCNKTNCIITYPDTLVLLTPDSKYLYCTGTRLKISWISHQVNFVNIKIAFNKGTTYNTVAQNIKASDNSFYWNIPDTIKNGTSFKIVITDVSNSKHSDTSDICTINSGVTVKAGSDTTVCRYVNITLTAISSTAIFYSWDNNYDTLSIVVSPDTGINAQHIITVINTQGCSNKDTVNVFVKDSVVVTITQNGNMLTASKATTYQWYFEGTPIQGATSQSYQANQTGNYLVVVDSSGCAGLANSYVKFVVVENYSTYLNGYYFYPNPFLNEIFVEYYLSKLSNVDFEVSDMLGRIIKKVQIGKQNQGQYNCKIDFNELDVPNGFYILKVNINDDQYYHKLTRVKP